MNNLLESIDMLSLIDTEVYIADNGNRTSEKKDIYNKDWSFKLTVFDLKYDSGVGNCRKQLVEGTNEEILFFIDPDMEIPHNYDIIIDQLVAKDELGGVSGLLLEHGRIFTSAADIELRDNTVYIDHIEEKVVTTVAGSYFIPFDFIPQVGAFKRDCVEEYTWDEYYRTQREHIDFFLGHKRETDWKFGMSPEVIFPHFPGGSDSYESHRHSNDKHRESMAYFQDKFNCDGLKNVSQPWIDTYPHYHRHSKIRTFFDIWRKDGINAALSKVWVYIAQKSRELCQSR